MLRFNRRSTSTAAAVVLLLVAAACTNPAASSSPPASAVSGVATTQPTSVESGGPGPTATDVAGSTDTLPPELAEAVADRAFVAWDGDFWAVGRYGQPTMTTSIPVAETGAYVAWGRAVLIREGEGSAVLTIIDPATGSVREVETPAPPGAVARSWATTDPAGSTVYFHYSIDGFDGGLRRIDVDTGLVTQLTETSVVDAGIGRSWMHWSPTGDSLASMLCGAGVCTVDLLDVVTSTVRRLATPFSAWAITDRFIFGRERTSDDAGWAVLDIEAGTVRLLPEGLIAQPNAVMALQDDRFLVDSGEVGQGRHDVVAVDAAGDEHRVIFTEPTSTLTGLGDNQFNPVPGVMLMAPGTGPGLIMIEVTNNGTPLSVITAEGQLYENVIPVIR